MRCISFIVVFLTFFCISASLVAETEIGISGEVRVRGELSKRPFYRGANPVWVSILRARAAITAVVDSNVTGFIEIQDSRDFHDDILGEVNSGERSNTRNLDAHQAYVEISRFLLPSLHVKAGRFEFVHGNERLFGRDDWHNVGLAFNGASILYGDSSYGIQLFGLAGPHRKFGYEGSSSAYIWGGAASFANFGLYPLLYYENFDMGVRQYITTSDRYTVALHGSHKIAGTKVMYNAAYQFGETAYTTGGSDQLYSEVRLDYEAWLLTAEVKKGFSRRYLKMIALGFDASSGDGPGTDLTIATFEAPYRSTGSFRGKDVFVTRGYAGTLDFYTQMTFTPHDELSIDLTVHNLRTQRGFSGYIDASSDKLPFVPNYERFTDAHNMGWQTDLEIEVASIDGLRWLIGGMAFFPTAEHAQRINPDPGYFAYTQMTVDF